MLMNAKSNHLVMQMLCVPTHLGPSLVPAMRDTVGMGSRVQVSTSVLTRHLCVEFYSKYTYTDNVVVSDVPPCVLLFQILMSVWSSHLVMRMLSVPTQLGPSRVSAMGDSGEMD